MNLRELIPFLGNGMNSETYLSFLQSLTLLLTLALIRALSLRSIRSRIPDAAGRYRWRKYSGYVFSILFLIGLAQIWLPHGLALGTYFGLLSAGLAIALRDPIANIVGWIFILWRKPFEFGDRIEVDGRIGDVVDQRIFAFSMLEVGNWVDAEQSTGRLLHIPNSYVFIHSIANHHHGFPLVWHELPVLITFESDWRGALKLLEEIADRHSVEIDEAMERRLQSRASRFEIHSGTLTPKVYLNVKDSGVELTMRLLTEVRSRRTVNEALWTEVLTAFEREDNIDLAYPTIRIYQAKAGETAAGQAD